MKLSVNQGLISLCVLALLGVTLVSCGKEKTESTQKTSVSIALSENDIKVFTGDTYQLTAKITGDNLTQESVRWVSSDDEVAFVNSSGLVYGKSNGDATIMAILEDKQATCKVKVRDKDISISLDQSSVKLFIERTCQLKATVSGEDSEGLSVAWATSDESIVTVDSEGLLTGIAEGNAVVSATVDDKVAECNVTVSSSYIIFTCSEGGAIIAIRDEPEGTTSYHTDTLSAGENMVYDCKYGFFISDSDEVEMRYTACYITSVDFSHWDASQVVDACLMFFMCSGLKNLPDISILTNVTDARAMFSCCTSLTTPPDLSALTNVTNARNMFARCSSLTVAPDLSSLTNLTNASGMFASCSSLTVAPDLSSLTNLTNAHWMFYYCSSLTTPPDVSALTNVTDASGMFLSCSSLTTPPDLSALTNVTNARNMFAHCSSLTVAPDLSSLTNLTNASGMFNDCTSLTTPPDLSAMTNVTDVSWMFNWCKKLTKIDLAKLDFTSVSYSRMITETSSLKSVTTHNSNEEHLAFLKAHIEETHSDQTVTQGKTSSDGTTIFTIE